MADQVSLQVNFNLEKLLTKPSWQTILIDLIEKNEIDPWNIDISDITSKFLQEVRKMKEMNFSIPANVILACAILLRFKSNVFKETLSFDAVEIPTEGEEHYFPAESLNNFYIPMRFPPKRMVSFNELISMVEEVIQRISKRVSRSNSSEQQQSIEIKLEAYDIEKEMENLLALMKELQEENMLLFSSLCKKLNPIDAFLPLLYLRLHNKISLLQEEFFGEIIIYLKAQQN